MVDLVRGQSTRFTSELVSESAPAWSANGTEVWYSVGTGEGDIYRKSANGDRPAEVALRSGSRPNINSATTGLALSPSPDGTLLLFTASSTRTKDDLWVLLSGVDSKPVPLLENDFDQNDGHISPDGRWIAYVSNESRSPEVFVRSLTIDRGKPTVGPGVLVSRGGGRAPRWRADARELYYQTLDAAIMAVQVVGNDVGTPSELARVPGALPDWGVSPDGQRFLVALPAQQTAVPPFTVLLNWQTSLGGTTP
jgi:Tol biopolymer transport system component